MEGREGCRLSDGDELAKGSDGIQHMPAVIFRRDFHAAFFGDLDERLQALDCIRHRTAPPHAEKAT